jgi:hypothetical protein
VFCSKACGGDIDVKLIVCIEKFLVAQLVRVLHVFMEPEIFSPKKS